MSYLLTIETDAQHSIRSKCVKGICAQAQKIADVYDNSSREISRYLPLHVNIIFNI